MKNNCIWKIFPTSPLPAGVVPCKYRIVVAAESRYVVADVGEAAGKRSDQEDLRLHDCSEAREQVGWFVIGLRNSKPEINSESQDTSGELSGWEDTAQLNQLQTTFN